MTVAPTEADPRDGRWRRLLVLVGLSGLGIAQPTLSMLGENAELFIFRDVNLRQALVLALAIVCVPPLLFWGAGELLGLLDRRIGRWAHLVSVGVLAAVAVVSQGKSAVGVEGWPLLLVAAACGVGFGVAYSRWSSVRDWSRLVAVVAPIALLAFIFGSPSGDVVRAADRASIGSVEGGDHPSVVVLLLDEFPTMSMLDADDGVSTMWTPNLAALTDEMTWYRNYTVRASLTSWSVPTILTGDETAGPPGIFTAYPDNLFTLLEDTHSIWASETLTKLCPFADCTGGSDAAPAGDFTGDALELSWARLWPWSHENDVLDDFATSVETDPDPTAPLLDRFDDPVDAMRGVDATVEKPELFQDFLDGIGPDEPPSLHFLHLMLPHQPWRYLPDGRRYETPTLSGGSYPYDAGNGLGEWVSALTEYRHLLQVQYTDALVGELVAHLKEAGQWDDSLVIVTADHGISFQPNTPIRTVTPDTVSDIAYAPLFVKLPGQESGGVDDTNVRAVDLLPTIADAVGVEANFPVDGLVLGDPGIAERGSDKSIRDIVDSMQHTDRGELDFTIDDTKPDAAGRLFADPPADAPPITALNEYLGIEDLVGSELAAVGQSSDSVAEVDQLGSLEHPDGSTMVGMVSGSVPDAGPDDLVLIAIDGVIRTGSPVFELDDSSTAFATMLPIDAMGEAADIAVGLLNPDGTIEALEAQES